MKANWAYLFPGQGSQAVGMGQQLVAEHPLARQTFEEADEVLQLPLSRLCLEGPADELRQTEITQPAVLTVSVAALRLLEAEGGSLPPPLFAAGHSLGEFTALVAAGALHFADALGLVRLRGRLMQEAVPDGEGAMLAVLGLPLAEVEALCQEASQGEVCAAANLNSPQQIVISGHAGAVGRARTLLKEQGKRSIPLPVSAPFHSSLMEPAAQGLAQELERISFSSFAFPVVSNVEAEPYNQPEQVAALLVRQVTSPVRWMDSVRRMITEGVEQFLEIGHGNVLSGLGKRIERRAPVHRLGSLEEIQRWLATVDS